HGGGHRGVSPVVDMVGGLSDPLGWWSSGEGQRMKLDGQAALVTGGGSGIGAATASLLALGVCKVALLDINDTAAKSHAGAIGGIAIRCDVADAASAEAAMAAARQAHGPARILINCAGVGTAGRVLGRDGPLKLDA